MAVIERIDICLAEKAFIHDQMDGSGPKEFEAGNTFIDCRYILDASRKYPVVYGQMCPFAGDH